VLPAVDYLQAQRLRATLCQAVQRAFDEKEIDTLCAPTLPIAAYGHDETTVVIDGQDVPIIDAVVGSTAPFNLTGLPVVSVPSGLTEQKLPVAVQFAGRPYSERMLLAIAAEYERRRGRGALGEHDPIRCWSPQNSVPGTTVR
jgi:aspartyl-tRNA(Asn)/glutamyl-tRNA(Gln) amidotransferase subunit A